MTRLARILNRLDESQVGVTLVYINGRYTIFMDDKKSPEFKEPDLKSLLKKMSPEALDLPSSKAKKVDDIISSVKGDKFDHTLDLSVPNDALKGIKFT